MKANFWRTIALMLALEPIYMNSESMRKTIGTETGAAAREENGAENGAGTATIGTEDGAGTAIIGTEAILEVIDKLVLFYSKNYGEMNLDGIFGLRALEGQLLNLLEGVRPLSKRKLISPPKISHSFKPFLRLQKLHRDAKSIADKALPSLIEAAADYAKMFKALVDRPFRLRQRVLEIQFMDPSLVWPPLTEELNDNDAEEMSDLCMSSLLGTFINTEKKKKFKRLENQGKCFIPDECPPFKFRRNTDGYLTTHQLLYAHLAKDRNCEKNFEAALLKSEIKHSSIKQWQTELCSNILVHANSSLTVNAGGSVQVKDNLQDLWLEQQFVCGFLGFHQVLSFASLKAIIAWQLEDGCFGKRQLRRHLLIESKVGTKGCLSHKTAVAAGALGVYLYYSVVAPSLIQKEAPLHIKTSDQVDITQNDSGDFATKSNRDNLLLEEERMIKIKELLKSKVGRDPYREPIAPDTFPKHQTFLVFTFMALMIFMLYKCRFIRRFGWLQRIRRRLI